MSQEKANENSDVAVVTEKLPETDSKSEDTQAPEVVETKDQEVAEEAPVEEVVQESASEAEEPKQHEFEERVVFVNRCSKVVKGGRRFSFSAVVVVGNRNGLVGYGFGKANEVADAIRKGGEIARKSLFAVTMKDKTIPHEVIGEFDGGRILLRPASHGTGVIAGGGMRAVLEVSGIRDVLGKSLGSNNKLNVVKATFDALHQLRSREQISATRNVEI